MDSESESKLISLFTQLLGIYENDEAEDISCINQIISIVKSLDLESQPKPESEFMSLILQTKSLFSSMDLDSHPKPLSLLISLFTLQLMNPTNSDEDEFVSLYHQIWDLEPEPELISLINRILSLVDYTLNSNLISLCPQAQVTLGDDNILHIVEEVESKYEKLTCFLNMKMDRDWLSGSEDITSYVFCQNCKGQNHERYEKAPVEIKHPLHPKHPLRLVFFAEPYDTERRECYCCDYYLQRLAYCCVACDFAMNLNCVEKPPVLSLSNTKRHDHPLDLFPRATSLICDVCALVDSTSATYICLRCNFVVHQRCTNLPSVIRISRHPQHRISFAPSFNQGNWSCGVCRKEINNDYGGYSCTKNDCTYAAHSKCATQSNVWDGEELEGVPEDDIGDVEPFVRISDGIIQHFSHQEHHLRLDKNKDRDYEEDKLCQACITPIYSGNLYACIHCDFILHEECATLPRKMYHPIHPHLLTLVRQDGDKIVGVECSTCPSYCAVGLFYECPREKCSFQVHVQCSVVSEPLDHASHMHPLFLTSKPGEKRLCSVCKQQSSLDLTNETFNCIECNFSLCFGCATLPQKVRYKHDKHMFILSYGEEISTMTSWCEVCEGKIDTKMGYYMCEKDCCVTLHIKCTIGDDLYMKPGSTWFWRYSRIDVVPNKQQMTRPICSNCEKRCPKAYFQLPEVRKMRTEIYCSISCVRCKDLFYHSLDNIFSSDKM